MWRSPGLRNDIYSSLEFVQVYNSSVHNDPCDLSHISIEVIDKCINIKPDKTEGPDGISAEQVHAHSLIYLHLCNLFKAINLHGFVPDDFGLGTTIPIIKDKDGDIISLTNYRVITLIPVTSKLFEGVLLSVCNNLHTSDCLQFAFTRYVSLKKCGCHNAVYTFRSIIDYCNGNGSTVIVAALDVSKALYAVNHFKLFSSLMKVGITL